MVVQLPPGFDESDYLAANPDVAAAVTAGALSSGGEHYRHYGHLERRALAPGARPPPLPRPFAPKGVASRRDKILTGLDLGALNGVEIGPLASPLVSRGEGRITYVDFTDEDTHRRTYAEDPNVNVDDIVHVDAIWGDKTLREALGPDRRVDYVVASHVVEHVPDLITWLSEIRQVLAAGGALRLVVPDRRYTFDYLRLESRFHDVLDAYLQKARRPLPRQIMDFCGLARHVNCEAAWNGSLKVDQLQPMSSIHFGYALAQDSIATGKYYDTHCWVFTPASFAQLFEELAALGLIGFAYEFFVATARNDIEFFVHMVASDDAEAIQRSWAQMRRDVA